MYFSVLCEPPMNENAQPHSSDYQTVHRLAGLVAPGVLNSIQDALRQLGDSHLIRAGVDSWRVKSQPSLMRKARERNWPTLAHAINEAPDLLGFRVVCHNLQDVERMVVKCFGCSGGIVHVQKHDFVKMPKADGYRAIHLLFRYQVKMASSEANLGCEIQVRSLLQNSWAQLFPPTKVPMSAAALAAGYLTEHFAPRSFFLLMTALSFLLTWFAFWKPAAVFSDLYEAPQARGSNLAGDIKRLTRHRPIYPALLIIGLWFFVPGTGTPLQFYLTNGLHLSDSVYADFWAILSFSNIPGILLYGALCRKVSLNKMLWWGTVIATPGLIPLLFIHSASLALLAATMSLSWGFAWAAYIDLATRSCPPGLRGTMMMLVAGATVLLTNAGNLAAAKIYSSSADHGFLYCVIAATVTTALILPAILLVPTELIATADGEPNRAIEAELVKELGAAGP